MGFFSGYHGRYTLGGLGRLTAKKTGSLSKDARRVVAAFMRGEEASGNCEKNGGCGIYSDGRRLLVHSPDNAIGNAHTLASRDTSGNAMEVCIPPEAELEQGPLMPGQRRKEGERSKDIRVTASALLQAVNAGVGVKTDFNDGKHYFSGSKGKSRVAVPGSCVRVKFDKKQRELAALTMEAKSQKLGGKAAPTANDYAKARAELQRANDEALAAKRKLAAEQAARDRPVKMAEKAIEKAEKDMAAAQKRLAAAREKAATITLARQMVANAPFMVNPAYGGGPVSKFMVKTSKPRKPRKKPAAKKAAKKAAAKKAPAKKKGKK